ncbi:PWWP domain-containing DNA repair factor 3A [Danio aesculapii]|uniref:PWWP domain-containing DNA repair factor 3A n=1 Tax=Danio aesculapii TaxID=1142201 RepID=UPI0024BF3AD7|nr:PWWP domain-containing DNA repair factor 3A [Danio aesculapii]
MVAGMSSSDESLKRQRNPHRTCRTDSTQVNKPVSGGTDSITHNKRTTAPQDLNLVKSRGRRTTENKPQAASQSLTCLRKSRRQVTNINGCVSKNSHKPEQVLPQKIATPKYQLKTAHKGRSKKKNVEPSEKEVAASKAKLDGLVNLRPEQHLSSQKTKRTHYQNSKRTQNHQTPSDVSTGVYTCTTLSPCRCKEDSCCHTNRPQALKQDRLQSSFLLSSTSNSDLKSLSPQTGQNSCAPYSEPDILKSSVEKRPLADAFPSPQRLRGRPKGNNNKVQEDPSASPPVKHGSESTECAVEYLKRSLRSSADLQHLSPQTAKSSCAPDNHQTARKSRLKKKPSAGGLLSPQRARGRPKGSKNKKVQHRPRASRPAKDSRKHETPPVESCSPKHPNSPSNSQLQPLTPKTDDNSFAPYNNPNAGKSQLEKRPPAPSRPRGRQKGSTNKKVQKEPSASPPVKRSRKFTQCLAESHTPKQKRLQSSPLLSSTPSSHLQPLTPQRADNNPALNARKSRLEKRPHADTSPSTPQRPRGRPKGSTNKKVQEGASVSPAENQTLSSPCFENQEPEPNETDQTMSSDLSIELSLQEDPHLLNRSLFMQEEEDDQDDDEEELPSFLGQDSKKPLSISEGLCVWCKMRKYPYWPAVVKSVNRKNKKASIIFIDCDLSDQKRAKKGFSVSLRNLKPFDCEDYENLVGMAKEKYGSAITWSVELISDYRIRIGCGSFSGSFIEYCAADISCPVRRKYTEGKSVLTFPSQEILGEKCDISENSAKDICAEHKDELLSQKRNLPDRAKAARTRANEQLVDFIIRGKVENHLLAIISESSAWMQALQKPFRQVVCPVLYLEDEGQVDKVFQYLQDLCETAPQINTLPENVQVDRVRLILDVLLPKAIIYAIAGVHNLSLEKAKEKYHKGPSFSNRERQEFDMMIERQMKLKEITQRHRR